jgi:penicillin-binding protein 1A
MGAQLVRVLLVLALLGAVAGAAVLGLLFLYYGSDPDLPRLARIADYHPKVVTRVLDRDGELLGEIFDERRTVVPREKIPPVMIHAIVDAEDAQFYEHKGLNWSGMLRAFLNNLRPGSHLQGGSTITQQLVKTWLLKTNERTVRRKVQEVILARRLESELTKDEILYLYLNQIYFGHLRYGVEEAARFFFGKSISDVNAGEAALLASLPKGPEEISPLRHPERAKDRQRYVLSQMLRYQHITQAEADRYAATPIEVVRQPPSVGSAPEFVDESRKALVARYGEKKLPYLGITVKTTCDSRIEHLAREALERNLESLDERQGYRKPLGHLKSVSAGTVKATLVERSLRRLHSMIEKPTKQQRERWLEEREKALDEGRTVEGVVVELRVGKTPGLVVDAAPSRGFLAVPVRADGKDARHDRYNPKGLPLDKRFSVGDIITVRAEPSLGESEDRLPLLVSEFGPQGAAMVIDPATREVRAMVGGYGFHPGGFNRATQARRQPGSAFKPFLYATAFISTRYTPATILDDSPQVYEQPGLKDWKPKNAESHQFLGPVRLRVALAKSLNTVASQLVYDLHPEALAQTAHLCGIDSKLDENLALGLGSSVVTLEELTNAYATFAAQGKKAPPAIFTSFGDQLEPRTDAVPALQPEIAYLVTSVMESVIEEGTAVAAKGKLKRPAAGKTGTTSSERDAWFVGFTPDVVAGVWVGFDDMRDLGHGEQGARSALPIWVDVMNGALKTWGAPPRPFAQPPSIVVEKIDPVTGLLAPSGASNSIDEVFLAGTAPTQIAPQAGEQNPDTFIIDQTR